MSKFGRWPSAVLGALLAWLGILQGYCIWQNLDGLSLTGRNRVGGRALALMLAASGVVLIALGLPIALLFLGPALLPALALLLGLGWLLNRQLPPLAGIPADDDPWTAEPVAFQDAIGRAGGLFLRAHRPNGATVCWVHGVGDNCQTYKWVILRALTARGINVLTFDLPGHGARRDLFSLPGGLGSVPAALAYLRRCPDVDPERIGLLGVSLGGMLSIRALAAGEHVRAAALLQVPCALRMSRRLWWREALSAISLPSLNVFGRCSPRELYRTWTPHSDFVPDMETVINALHPDEHIGHIPPLPMLLLYGERDPIAPVEHGLRLYERANHPKTFRTIRAASHVSLIFMRETAEVVGAWFAEHL